MRDRQEPSGVLDQVLDPLCAARTFVDDLDSQLPVERSAAGEPSATDFLLYDLPRLRDQLSADFVGNTLSLPGLAPLRMMIATGTLMHSVALYAYVDANDDVAVVALDVAMRTGDELG